MNREDIKTAVFNEFNRIDTEELAFHSDHEGWAVLLEEVEEAKEELVGIEDATEALKHHVFADDFAEVKVEILRDIRDCAICCAAEAVQVAAVATKFIRFKEEQR